MSQNYHIASLAGGVLVLGGLGYMAQSSAKEVEEGFAAIGGKKETKTTVDGVPEVTTTIKSLSGPNPLTPKNTPEGREVDLFTSVDLFIKDGDASGVIDLLQEPDVHPPIPNKWWVENRVDPSWSDAPMEDKDGDGFFNGEEHKAKTDPSDPKSHGDLIDKLEVVSVSSDVWLLDFKGVIGDGRNFHFEHKAAGATRWTKNRTPAADQIADGDVFFPEEPGQRRFKLIKVEEREFKGRIGTTLRKYATVQDLRPNKKDKTYVIPYQVRQNERKDHYHFDHTVTFRLNAIGEDGNSFEVEENGTFAIPQGSPDKSYKLIEVNLDMAQFAAGKVEIENVVVEYGPEGAKKTEKISPN